MARKDDKATAVTRRSLPSGFALHLGNTGNVQLSRTQQVALVALELAQADADAHSLNSARFNAEQGATTFSDGSSDALNEQRRFNKVEYPQQAHHPYIALKPLPLDGAEKNRMAAFDWTAYQPVAHGPSAAVKGKGRATEYEAQEDGASRSADWQEYLQAAHTTVDDLGNLHLASPTQLSTQRLSVASDTPSTIAFPAIDPVFDLRGPAFVATSVPRGLSPIPEAGTPELDFTNPFGGPKGGTGHALRQFASTSTIQARPALHVNPSLPPSRKPSDLSLSVYSRGSYAAPELDEYESPPATTPAPRSHFSPDTPLPLSTNEGLAISGADLTPPPPPDVYAPTESNVPLDPLPTPTLPSQYALLSKPSFSGFRFPSTSSNKSSSTLATAEDTPPSPLFDRSYPPGLSSSVTVATSTFEPALSTSSDECASVSGAVPQAEAPEVPSEAAPFEPERGQWRRNWRWSLVPSVRERALSEVEPDWIAPSRALTADERADQAKRQAGKELVEIQLELPAARDEIDEAAPIAQVLSRSVPIRLVPPTWASHKALPPIPDNASIFSDSASLAPGEEVVRVEVYCQRELVRKTRNQRERVVIERTLLYGEEAQEALRGGIV
ncbi:hypothetical protein Rhopal_000981-T1 [Rhodotorula paludigena]|uniref:Proteophosphoglycan ppg4 n=1 Tax=Rhodotorula paludigena TaxID=86838 RepID=A0AAV5G6G4_9BASI|nr:hypothetical protein Rhopal_000981-T1 [Rhodotorula paludigena]